MKKWLSIIGLIILFILIGIGAVTMHGNGQRSYQAELRHGQDDVIDQNYHDALNYYQGARKVNPASTRSQNDIDQTQSYVSGNYYLNRRRLNLAAKNYRRSIRIRAVAALNHRSLVKYRQVTGLQTATSRFTRLYDRALMLNHQHRDSQSNRCLAKITRDPQFSDHYFQGFRQRVKRLEKADRDDKRSDQVTTSVRSASKRNRFKLTSPRLRIGSPSKVTITKARHEIRRAGVNAREMSNDDVANLIKQARRHHASICKYAKRNY